MAHPIFSPGRRQLIESAASMSQAEINHAHNRRDQRLWARIIGASGLAAFGLSGAGDVAGIISLAEGGLIDDMGAAWWTGLAAAVGGGVASFGWLCGADSWRLRRLYAAIDARHGWRPRQDMPHPPGRTDVYDRYLIERHAQDGYVYVGLSRWELEDGTWQRTQFVNPQGYIYILPSGRGQQRANPPWKDMYEPRRVERFHPEHEDAERCEYEDQLRAQAEKLGRAAEESWTSKRAAAEQRRATQELAAQVVEKNGLVEPVVI